LVKSDYLHVGWNGDTMKPYYAKKPDEEPEDDEEDDEDDTGDDDIDDEEDY